MLSNKIVIVGGPGRGKSTLAREILSAAPETTIYCTDNVATDGSDSAIVYVPSGLDWSATSQYVVDNWLTASEPYVIEGIATARALRKAIEQDKAHLLSGVKVVVLDTARTETTIRQDSTHKAVMTVWEQISTLFTETTTAGELLAGQKSYSFGATTATALSDDRKSSSSIAPVGKITSVPATLRRSSFRALKSNSATAGYKVVHGLAGGSTVHEETLAGRSYLVVPVIALIGDTVVWPANSTVRELVPASALSENPGAWNGHTIVPYHPETDDFSANTTEVFENLSFGLIFNSRFEAGCLQVEAWLDLQKAEQVGDLALSVIERCRSGELVDVSIGAYVTSRPATGTVKGLSYSSVWVSLTPDHLAMLPVDNPGACSVEMGCGAPRTASKHKLSRSSLATQLLSGGPKMKKVVKPQAAGSSAVAILTARLRSLIDRVRTAASPVESDAEEVAELVGYTTMQSLLTQAADSISSAAAICGDLIADENDPTETPEGERAEEVVEAARIDAIRALCYSVFSTISSVLQVAYDLECQAMDSGMGMDDSRYLAGARHSTKDMKDLQAAHDSLVSLGAQCDTTDAKTAAANDKTKSTTAAAAPCSCGNHDEETTMANATLSKADLVGRILSAPGTPYKAEHKTALEAFAEPVLVQLAAIHAPEGTTAPAALAASAPVAAQDSAPAATTLSAEEWLKAAPAEVRDLFARNRREEDARRKKLISGLSGSQKVFSAEQLAAKSTDDLLDLSKILSQAAPPADFSGRGVGLSSHDDDGDYESDTDDGADEAPVASAWSSLKGLQTALGRDSKSTDEPKN